MADYLLLKWGTIKGYCFKDSPEAFEALQEYGKLGVSITGCATQEDTQRQKELICVMIDKVNGKVSNDWTGKTYRSKKAAKKYIMEYGK